MLLSNQFLAVVTWTFDDPVNAWGADFRSRTQDPNATDDVEFGMSVGNTTQSFSNTSSFFGVMADASSFTTVTVTYVNLTGALHAGVDDLEIVEEPVPEPSGFALMGIAAVSLSALKRRSRRTTRL